MPAPFDFFALARRIGARARAIAARGDGRELLGSTNPLGQGTIKADVDLENMVIDELKNSKIPCTLATEEAGLVEISAKPEWRFALDPLDGSENYKRGVPLYCLGICYAPEGGSLKDVRESFVCSLTSNDEFYARAGSGTVLLNGRKAFPAKTKAVCDAVISVDLHRGDGAACGGREALPRLAAKDFRRFGPDLFDLCCAASGGVDAFVLPKPELSAVHASGAGIARESCIVTDADGGKLDCALTVETRFSIVAACTKELHAEIVGSLRSR